MKVQVDISYPKLFSIKKEKIFSRTGIQFDGQLNKYLWYKMIAKRIYECSQVYVPVDTGRLKASGKIVEQGGLWRVEYTEPYAIFVHEVWYLTHKAPTRYLYLEDAAYQVLAEISAETGDITPAFTFHLEMDTIIGVKLYIDSISMDEFVNWVRKTRGPVNIDTDL